MEIVCFIQNEETREVYQSCAYDIAEAPEGGDEPIDPSANEEDAMPNVRLYPNPAVEQAYISGLEDATVQVYDLTGRLVYEMQKADNRIELPVETWQAGTYVVRIEQAGRTATRKLSVIR